MMTPPSGPGGIGTPRRAPGPPGASGVMAKVKGQRSMFNPQDIAMMMEDGTISMEMPVVQVLEVFGIDPQGPFSQLARGFQQQMKSANPLEKMKAIGGQGPRKPGPPGPQNFGQMFPTGGQ
jgi:hypothetical protein